MNAEPMETLLKHAEPMETLLKSQYDRLSPEKMVHLRQQLQDFATAYDGRLSVGTACSGTDVLIHVLADWLVPWWNKTFGFSIEVGHAFSCEVVEWKASWILAHFKPRYLFSDLFDLAKDTARDLISNGLAPVPSVSCFACGVECDTLSQLNNHRDPDCVSTGTGKTGTTAVACFQYLRRHRPQFFFVENVRTLASESKASSSCRTQQSKNPLQLITEWANDLGYVIFSQLLDSCHYGVPQHRPRYYVFGFFVGNERSEPGTGFNQTDEDYIFPQWIHRVPAYLTEMQCDMLPVERFLLESDKPRGAQLWEPDDDKQPVEDSGGKKPKFEVDHCHLFQQDSVQWPPVFTDTFIAKTRHLPHRKKEVLFYHEHMLGGVDTLQEETYLDLNYSIKWCRAREAVLPCIVSTSFPWRMKAGMELLGEELLCMQGFSYNIQQRAAVGGRPFSQSEKTDLAGNAFNGAVLLSVMTSAMAAYPWIEFKEQHLDVLAEVAVPEDHQGNESSQGSVVVSKADIEMRDNEGNESSQGSFVFSEADIE